MILSMLRMFVQGAWPLCAGVLGVWVPLDFLQEADGYLFYLSNPEWLFVYGTAFLSNSLLALGASLALALVVPFFVKFDGQEFARKYSWAALLGARFTVGLALAGAAMHWVEAVVQAPIGSTPFLVKLSLVVFAGIIAYAIGRRSPSPGLGFATARGITALGAAVTMIAVPAEAWTTWRDGQPATAVGATHHRQSLPDVVLVTIDTLSALQMSLYGGPHQTTPRLEEFSQGAAAFDRCYANSNFTSAGVASILYGVRPWRHRALQQATPLAHSRADNLLRRFHDAGYRVLTVETNDLGSARNMGVIRWVDRAAEDNLDWIYQSHASLARLARLRSLTLGARIGPLKYVMGYLPRFAFSLLSCDNCHFDPERALSAAKLLWEAEKGQPRFLWVHLYPPHAPYAPPEPFLGAYNTGPLHRTLFDSTPPALFQAGADPRFPRGYLDRYREAIRYVDHHVGEFLDWLKSRGEFDDLLIAVTSDHGESFSRGYGSHRGPLLTEELIRIPLIVKPPRFAGPVRSGVLCEQADLAPTLTSLAGLETRRGYEGRDLFATQSSADHAVFSMNMERNRRLDALERGTVAMIQGRWKYVQYFGKFSYPKMPELTDELYDVQSDPHETKNVAADHPEIVGRMRSVIGEKLRINGGPAQ